LADGKKQRPREILDVDVKEVSMVDHAANLRRFLIIKRIEEENEMPNFETDDVRKAAMTEEEKKKAAEEKAKAEEEKKKAAEEKAKADEEKEIKKGANPKAVAGMLSGIKGLPSAAVKEVIAALQAMKAAPPPADGEEPPVDDQEQMAAGKAKAKKSIDSAMVVIGADGEVIINESVTKRRQFTADRVKSMADAAMGMMKLLKEVDEEACKGIIATIKELPSNAKVAPAVKPTGTGKAVKKSENEEALEAELKKRDERIDALEKQIQEVTKSREPSKSVDDLGGTDKEKVQKSKSLFKGVI